VFGLHANADIKKDQQETDQLLDALLASQGSGGSGGGGTASRDSLLGALVASLVARVPPEFDIEEARYRWVAGV
jgi:dynein heavy chain